VICALLFAFISCSEPVSQINTLMNKLDAPANLKADVYDGVIITRWDLGVNARKYDVYRRDAKNKVSVTEKLNKDGPVETLYYIDWVGWDNQLQDGIEYEYTIVALSEKTNYDTGGEGGADMIVQNSASKVRAKAKVPASLTVALAEADVTLTTSGDFLIVSFPNAANLKYTVAYTFGQTETIVREFAKGTDALGDWYYPRRVAKFPILGGTNAITVNAGFGTDYYTETASVFKVTDALTAGETPLAKPVLTASRLEGKVKLSWGDVTGATEYKIYKVEISGNASNPNAFSTYDWDDDDDEDTPDVTVIGTEGITVTGDWTAVTAKADLSGSTWTAYDPLTKDTGYYMYAIVAKGTNASSKAAFATAEEYEIPAITTLAVKDGKDAKNKKITWNVPDTTVTYTLTYAEVKHPDGDKDALDNAYEVVSDYTTVTVTPGTHFVKGGDLNKDVVAVVDIDLSAKVGKNLIFKLVASKNGAESKTASKVLASNAFSTMVKFKLIVDNSVEYKNFKSVCLALDDNTTFREVDYTFSLYRRITTDGKETPFELVTLGASATYKAKVTDDDDNSWTFEDTNLDPTVAYAYKLVAKGFDNSDTNKGVLSNVRTVGYNKQISSVSGGTYNTTDEKFGPTGTGYTQGTVPKSSVTITGTSSNMVGTTVTLEYESTGTGNPKLTTTGVIDHASNTVPKGETVTNRYFMTISKPAAATIGASTSFKVVGYDNGRKVPEESSDATFTVTW
jgi:hypothetical protein